MLGARLPLALNGGGLAVPDVGRIAVFHPTEGADLGALDQGRVHIIQPSKPLYDAFDVVGYDCGVMCQDRYVASIVCLPRAKAEAYALIAQAAAVTDGPVIVDGQKTDGADAVLKALRKRGDVSGPINKAHGKLYWMNTAPDLADWAAGPALTEGGFWTAPGVFSADGVDVASAMLAEALPQKLGKTVVDLGAGWGFLSAHILTRDAVDAVHLVEANHMALECAKRNVTDPRARYHWADATTWAAQDRVDAVVMNPPFHTGRAADPALGRAFIAAAARMLAPSGSLWMVANRHLPYEDSLSDHFVKIVDLGGDARFKLVHALRPKKKRS
ncbi:methyltransferase [Ascidiaceihabitans sp.]|uniref:class I SAM-dependent methyltransferase n=1 Tax=Ascidiaceihabitans sp. TaxID=1872644 RepID=UPI00329945B8